MEKKFTDTIKEINAITNKMKDPNSSIEEAIEDFKTAKKLIEEAEVQLKKIEDEVYMVLEDNNTTKNIDVK
jgi:exodeoxyribonuclease VII small subunit